MSGIVVASGTGTPVAGVAVSSGGRSATTAADGRYALSDVPANARTIVAFERAGYAKQVLTVALAAKGTVRANARVTPVGASQTIDPASAATVTVPGSVAQVGLPAEGFVTASGAAPTGAVTVQVTPIDPAGDPANMPGNYTALVAGSSSAQETIESFGAINVTLADAAGNKLNLAPGKTATIRIPVSTRSPSVPPAMTLYYFDETSGLWVQEGTATLAGTAPNLYYEGPVNHFTTWNADKPTETVIIDGFVRFDPPRTPCIPAVTVSSYGVDYSGSASVEADATCRFSVPVRRGGRATIVAQVGDGTQFSNPVSLDSALTLSNNTLPNALVLSAVGAAPQIVDQPQSQTVQVDTFAFFSVAAVGSPVLTYQWRRAGVDLPGETRSYLVRQPVPAGDNGVAYTVRVSNAFGNVISAPAVLAVSTDPLPPLVLGQPLPQTVLVGASATFTVSALSQGGALGYQWRRNGTPIAGATGTLYTTPPTEAGDNGAVFSVLVTSSNGTSAASDGAALTVNPPTPLAIAGAPLSVSVGVGQSASFTVTAVGGSAPITYQWRRNGVDITGATRSGYSTPATTLADSGSQYSVVVASGSESLTSSAATLTVTPPVSGNGFYLLAQAGPATSGTITYADGVQTTQLRALLAVNPASPGSGAVTVDPAATVGDGQIAVGGTVSGGQVSNVRTRATAYFKAQDGRFHVVDQVVADGSLPTPTRVSSLTSAEVCSATGSTVLDNFGGIGDLVNPLRSWVFLPAPGADAACGTDDDTVRAVRLDMPATTAALTLTAIPQVEIRAADGSLSGYLVLLGNQMQRLDANLANPVNLFTVDPATYKNAGLGFGSTRPGIWLFTEGGKLWGVNLATPGTRVALTDLADGEDVNPLIASDGATAYVGLQRSTGPRVLRIGETLAPAGPAFVTINAGFRLNNLAVTPTRLIVHYSNATNTTVQSFAKNGAAGLPPNLGGYPAGTVVAQVLAAGENIYLGVIQVGASGTSTRTEIVNSDGSNRQVQNNTDLKFGISAATVAGDLTLPRSYGVLLAEGGTGGAFSNAGATVRLVEGATRATLVTYGVLPTAPDGFLLFGSFDPWQYGQSGLLSYTGAGSQNADLYYYKSDTPGLVKVTNFLTATGAVAPMPTGRSGPAGATRGQPGRARPG